MKFEPPYCSSAQKKMKPSDHEEYSACVKELANSFNIANHRDSSQTIKAIRLLLEANCLESREKESNDTDKTKAIYLNEADKLVLDQISLPVKFEEKQGDEIESKALKVLKLLYLRDLKELQVDINTIITSIQAITAPNSTALLSANTTNKRSHFRRF